DYPLQSDQTVRYIRGSRRGRYKPRSCNGLPPPNQRGVISLRRARIFENTSLLLINSPRFACSIPTSSLRLNSSIRNAFTASVFTIHSEIASCSSSVNIDAAFLISASVLIVDTLLDHPLLGKTRFTVPDASCSKAQAFARVLIDETKSPSSPLFQNS